MCSNTCFDAFAMQDEWNVSQTFGIRRRMEFAGIYRF